MLNCDCTSLRSGQVWMFQIHERPFILPCVYLCATVLLLSLGSTVQTDQSFSQQVLSNIEIDSVHIKLTISPEYCIYKRKGPKWIQNLEIA